MLRSFRELVTTDSGVQIERVASMELSLPNARYADQVAVRTFHNQLLERLRNTPGIEAAASINEVPLRGEFGIGLSATPEGKPSAKRDEGFYPQYLRVTPDYFRIMGIRILAGRSLGPQDDLKHPGAVVNKAMADALSPGQQAIGLRFAFGTMPGEKPDYITVVGIVANVRSRSLELAPAAQMYLPFMDSPTNFAGIVVRSTGDTRALVTALRQAVRGVDPEQAVYNVQMLDETVSKNIAPRRTNTILFATFGALAVVLSAFGVYAVIANGVAQQTREIGIRLALGAEVHTIMRMVMREGLTLGVAGIVIGLAGAWALSRIMESLLFGVSVRDFFTFAASAVLLLVVAVFATLLPARMASRVDPIKALQME
ncbi:MAG: FtsX-like permease family protein [Phycisphaerae bacterium]|nr:FtsX-like permease family protein [Gemmatimonadaceae bacterium]